MENKMDIIISLVGFNPIPNYVSILNYCRNNSKLFIIHSDKNETVSSLEVAKNIEKVTLQRFEKAEATLIESSKSEFNSINKILNSVKEEILKIINSSKQSKIEILLDITGSTKPNAAFAYSILNSYFEQNDKVRFYQCYVSSEEEKIYQSGYENRIYSLKDLAKESKITKKEILNLHGYEEYKKINENINIIKNIVLENFTLIFHIESNKQRFREVKEDMFIALDIAERLGGSLSKILFEANSFINDGKKGIDDEEKAQKDFIEMFQNGTNKRYTNRITLKSLCDGYCNDEEIEKLVQGGKN